MKSSKFSLLAFLMSCLMAGWGLVYVGRLKWAIRVATVLYVGVLLLGVSGLAATPVGLYVLFAFIILVKLASGIASAVLARRYDGPPGVPRRRDLRTSRRHHVQGSVARLLGLEASDDGLAYALGSASDDHDFVLQSPKRNSGCPGTRCYAD